MSPVVEVPSVLCSIPNMAAQQEYDAGIPALEASLNLLLIRAQTLVNEITAFESLLHSTKSDVDVRAFKREVCGERRALEWLSVGLRSRRGEPEEDSSTKLKSRADLYQRKITSPSCVANRIHSSNLSWYETLWAVAKCQRGVTGILRKVQTFPSRAKGSSKSRFETEDRLERADGKDGSFRENLVVDIVAKDGLEWIKVSTITTKRLLYEIAKEGWNEYDSASELGSDAGSDEPSKSVHDSGDLALVKFAQEMKNAARAIRVRYRHPKMLFILPNITEGVVDKVDEMIAAIRGTEATVECRSSGFANDAAGTDDLRTMLPSTGSSAPRLTSTLNIDCTILLSLVSDISHKLKEDLLPAPVGRYCKEVLKQLEVDARSPLLPNELYPIMINTDLVCTTEAARRMREIVETMGTCTEKRRADVFFGEGTMADWSSDLELLSALRECSAHAVPCRLKLPIKVIHYDADAVLAGSISAKNLPVPIARNVISKLRLNIVNKSMILYGWDAGIVTLTGNRVVTSQVERAINEALNEAENGSDGNGWRGGPNGSTFPSLTEEPPIDAEESEHGRSVVQLGPDFWYSTPRSLIGKDKGQEGGIDHLNASRRAWEEWVAEQGGEELIVTTSER